jgi:hypothetical protein
MRAIVLGRAGISTDGEWREAGCGLRRGHADDHDDKQRGQHRFDQRDLQQREMTLAAIGIRYRSEVVPLARCRSAGQNEVEHGGGDDATDHLNDDVRNHVCCTEPPSRSQTAGHRRIEMGAGDWAGGIGTAASRADEFGFDMPCD